MQRNLVKITKQQQIHEELTKRIFTGVLPSGSLLPALSAARERSRNANCVGKLKQIGLAEQMYSGVNKEHIAVDQSIKYDNANSVTLNSAFYSNMPPALLRNGGYFGVETPPNTADSQTQAVQFFQCPSDTVNFSLTSSYSSYQYYVWKTAHTGWGSPAVEGRYLMGRDNPGSCIWVDRDFGSATTTPNHSNNSFNRLHLGGHVSSRIITAAEKAYGWGDKFRKARNSSLFSSMNCLNVDIPRSALAVC